MKLEGALTEKTVNQRMLSIDYACRGPILERTEQIEREIEKGVPKPFGRVIRANIGDPHALGQKPITFLRQVVGLCACPDLLPTANVPSDVKKRVQEILADCSSGARPPGYDNEQTPVEFQAGTDVGFAGVEVWN
ncbi:hypothetical protein NE865_14895 [Phthorimaea operculella]|nr:hypothetical protein NE865_14895 [Phthorimaea operculella]